MRKKLYNISATLIATMVLSFSSFTAFAADEKRVELPNDIVVTISNVVEEKLDESNPDFDGLQNVNLFIADAPAVVTFDGKSIGVENISYVAEGKIENGQFTYAEDAEEEVKFDVQKYVISDESGSKTVESLPENYADVYYYEAGNYATLSKPGYYLIAAAAPAATYSSFVVQVREGSAEGTTEESVEGTDAGTKEETAEGTADAKLPETAQAVPTASKVLVDSKEVSFEAYNIDDNNFFKLRDLAMAVNGSGKNFEVSWDSANNAIMLTSGKAYTADGNELTPSANPANKTAQLANAKIYLDEQEVQLTAYNIDGNNYFKLRDIAKLIGFGITWDGETNTIGIDTASAYQE